MKSFKDRNGKDWQIDITVDDAKRLRDRLGLNLYKLVENDCEGLTRLMSDPIDLVDAIYVLCETQAAADKIDDVAFGRSLAGSSLYDAGTAFKGAFFDFFPDRKIAASLQQLDRKGTEAMEILLQEANLELDKLTPQSMAAILKKKFGLVPESSESIQENLPSAN